MTTNATEIIVTATTCQANVPRFCAVRCGITRKRACAASATVAASSPSLITIARVAGLSNSSQVDGGASGCSQIEPRDHLDQQCGDANAFETNLEGLDRDRRPLLEGARQNTQGEHQVTSCPDGGAENVKK
jgi:hypothetical protein